MKKYTIKNVYDFKVIRIIFYNFLNYRSLFLEESIVRFLVHPVLVRRTNATRRKEGLGDHLDFCEQKNGSRF